MNNMDNQIDYLSWLILSSGSMNAILVNLSGGGISTAVQFLLPRSLAPIQPVDQDIVTFAGHG